MTTPINPSADVRRDGEAVPVVWRAGVRSLLLQLRHRARRRDLLHVLRRAHTRGAVLPPLRHARRLHVRSRTWFAGVLPWAIAGIALLSLIALVVGQRFGARPSAAPESEAGGANAPFAGGAGAMPRAPDISQMTPQQQAERLYDRIMREYEAGQIDNVRTFMPMAIAAYERLAPLSLDQRYDLGRIGEVGGDTPLARAQSDTILRTRPTHLLGLILAAKAARMEKNETRARELDAKLLAAEPTERAAALPEYLLHKSDIDAAVHRGTLNQEMTTLMTTIHVAHSPDSDDAFMFYALAAGKIDTEGLTYVHELQDIESLNQRAMRGELEVTAVSIHAYAYLSDQYALLPHGASMGDRYGPRLVAREPATRADVKGKRIAIPGPLTSAYLALQMYEPDFTPVFTPVRSHRGRGRERRRGHGAAHPRRPAHLWRPRPAPGGRHGRVVVPGDRTAPSAGRQRHPKGLWGRSYA